MSYLPSKVLSPSLISLTVSVDVKHHVYLLTKVLQCPAFHPKCYNVLPSIRVFALHYDLCPLRIQCRRRTGELPKDLVSQSVSQSVVSQSIIQSVISQSVSRSVSQSVSWSVDQSVRQDCFPLPVE